MKYRNFLRPVLTAVFAMVCAGLVFARELKVPKITAELRPTAADVPALLDDWQVPCDSLTFSNWDSFPYLPDVKFRLAHTGDAVLLHFIVDEDAVRAEVADDNAPIYFDSCVEFFVAPDAEDDTYYNFESNCIGRMIVQGGRPHTNRPLADAETLAMVDRWSSLGTEPFGLVEQPTHWELTLVIPRQAFFLNPPATLSGCRASGNFYKCGDNLPQRHYSSWAPISAPRPAFHSPESFMTIVFE